MTVALGTSAAAACGSCGAALAGDQRYCLTCGARVGALRFPGAAPIARPGRPRTRFQMPAPRSAVATAATTLAFGVFVGLVIAPSLGGTSLATAPMTIALPASDAGAVRAGGAGGSDTGASLGSPVANTPIAPATALPPPAPFPVAPAPILPAAPVAPAPAPVPPEQPGGGGGGGGGTPTPPPDTGATIDGTVVHLNPAAGSYAVATTTGQLFAVHSESGAKRRDRPASRAKGSGLPKIGDVVSAPVKPLFNGTFAEKGNRTVDGDQAKAKFSGTVGYVDEASSTYTISVRGVSALIHVPGDGGAAPKLPAVGDYGAVSVSIEDATPPTAEPPPLPEGCTGPDETTASKPPASTLVQTKFQSSSPSTYLYFEGVVDGVCPDTNQLVISADDAGESLADLALPVATGIKLSKVDPGMALTADGELADDGSIELSGVASDAGLDGADDSSSGQGDLSVKAVHAARARAAGYATRHGKSAANPRARRRAAIR